MKKVKKAKKEVEVKKDIKSELRAVLYSDGSAIPNPQYCFNKFRVKKINK